MGVFARRRFLIAAGGLPAVLACWLAMWPRPGFPTDGRKVARVHVLLPTRAGDDVTGRVMAAFKRRLADLGWRDGANIAYTIRYAGESRANYDRLAREAIAGKPDLIFVSYGPFASVVAAHAVGIPIVFLTSRDPVAQGLVSSLAKPGGNATGVSTRSRELVGKRLQLMQELLPSMSKIGVVRLMDLPRLEGDLPIFDELKQATAQLGLKLIEARHQHGNAGAFGLAFAELRDKGADAVATVLDWNYPNYREFLDQAVAARLPTVCDVTEFVDSGGLISLAANYEERWIRSADHASRILHGASPGDLPVEEPTVFELAVNLKTARALRLTVPRSILLRADRVIE
jgi:putative ABC transport system substrate-binding protein